MRRALPTRRRALFSAALLALLLTSPVLAADEASSPLAGLVEAVLEFIGLDGQPAGEQAEAPPPADSMAFEIEPNG